MKGIAKEDDPIGGLIAGKVYTLKPLSIQYEDLVCVEGDPRVYFIDEFIITDVEDQINPKPQYGFWKRLLVKLGIADEVS